MYSIYTHIFKRQVIHFLFHSLLNVRLLFLWMNEVNYPVGRALFIPSSYVNNLRIHPTVWRILYSVHFWIKIFLIYLNNVLLLALLPNVYYVGLAGPFLCNMMILSHHLSFFCFCSAFASVNQWNSPSFCSCRDRERGRIWMYDVLDVLSR